MQQHGSEYFACNPPPPPPLADGVKGQNLTFSEHGHVAYMYQIKWNHKI